MSLTRTIAAPRTGRPDGRDARRVALVLFGTVMLLCGCAPAPTRIGYPSQWIASPNFNDRRPSYVILHHTTGNAAEHSIKTLTDPLREVSAHYLIARDGVIYQLVDERFRAWHAGQSGWGADADLNSSSIGIELDNNGNEAFPARQVEALLALLADIKARYRIPTANFIGHADVAPGRKTDPSAWFPWRELAQRGYGLWCDPPYSPAPAGFDPVLALQALGYDVTNREAAVYAFKLHFVQASPDSVMTPSDQDLIHCLLAERARARRADQAAPPVNWPARSP